MIKQYLPLFGLTLLFGCTSTVSNELYSFGEQQALAGEKQLERLDVRKRTLRQSVTADEYSEYLNGYADGLAEFCTSENAKQLGLAGRAYNDTCDSIQPNFEAIYLEAYEFRAGISK